MTFFLFIPEFLKEMKLGLPPFFPAGGGLSLSLTSPKSESVTAIKGDGPAVQGIQGGGAKSSLSISFHSRDL
jgi:hypothetical protein